MKNDLHGNRRKIESLKLAIWDYSNQLENLQARDGHPRIRTQYHIRRVSYLLNEIERLEGELEKEYE